MKRMVTLGLLILLFAATAPRAAADTFIEQLVEQTIPNQPVATDTITIWMSADRMAILGAGQDILLRLDLSQLYLLNAKEKSYSVLSLPIDLGTLLPPDDPQAPMLKQMLTMTQAVATVTPTDVRKQIGPWEARRYDMEIKNDYIDVLDTLWASQAVPIDMKLYNSLQENLLALNPVMRNAAASMRRIEGVVVLQEATIAAMGMTTKTRTEILKVGEKEAPAGAYQVPKGFEKHAFNPLARGQ